MKSRVRRYRKPKTQGQQLATPELLIGARGAADWYVREAFPGEIPHTINKLGGEGELVVPAGNGREAELIRLHEMLHAAHSPVEAPKALVRSNGTEISIEAIAIAEEIRINSILRFKMGTDWLKEAWAEKDTLMANVDKTVEDLLTLGTPDSLLNLLKLSLVYWPLSGNHMSPINDCNNPVTTQIYFIANNTKTANIENGMSTKDANDLVEWQRSIAAYQRSVLIHIWEEYFNQGFEKLGKNEIPTWKEDVIPLAEYLDRIFKTMQAANTKINNILRGSENPGEDRDLQILDRFNELPRYQVQREMRQLTDPEFEAGDDKPNFKSPPPTDGGRSSDGKVRWGEMNISKPKRPHKLPGKKRQKSRYKASDIGVVPKYIHRDIVDGQVFATKRSFQSGSVLIDDSGSMGYTMEQIKEIVLAVPGVAIGAYSGGMVIGELVEVARDGTWAGEKDLRPAGANNLVDGPALEWLAKQPEPRLWVTDGGVTTKTGSYVEASKQCKEFCVKNKINIVENVEEASEVFWGKRRVYR